MFVDLIGKEGQIFLLVPFDIFLLLFLNEQKQIIFFDSTEISASFGMAQPIVFNLFHKWEGSVFGETPLK